MTEQDREAFEAFQRDKCKSDPSPLVRAGDGSYGRDTVRKDLKVWLAALAHRDEQIAEVTQQRDELVEAGQFSRIAAASGHYDEAMATFYATLDRIESAQPKEQSDDHCQHTRR